MKAFGAPPVLAPVRRSLIQLAAFRVGEQEYALDIMAIRAIINVPRIVRVPRLPAFVEGVIELRGEVLPVVDLRRRFEVVAGEPTRAMKVILVRFGESTVGLIVDAVSEVVRRSPDDVRPAPGLAVGANARFFKGVLAHDGRTLIVLDPGELLSPDELAALESRP